MERTLKFRAWHTEKKRMFEVWGLGRDFISEDTLDGVDPGTNAFCGDDMNFIQITQFTGMLHQGKTEVYEDDILYDTIEYDHGDEVIWYIITWIKEKCAFVFLTKQERKDYDEQGFNAIERDFEGFYWELDQESLNKMRLKGNIHQNTELYEEEKSSPEISSTSHSEEEL